MLFVSPPDIHAEGFDLAAARRGRYPNYPPYGLALVAAAHEADGHDCEVINLQGAVLRAARSVGAFDFAEAWQVELRGRRPDFIFLTCMFSQTHKSFAAVSAYLAELYPGARQVAGGVHVTGALSQPETRRAFLEDLPHIADFHKGEFKPANEIAPAWHLIDPRLSSQYGTVGAFHFLRDGNPVVATVLSNRGCRAHCTFCSVRQFNGDGVRRRTAASVVDELLLLQDKYAVEHVMWLDDDLLYDRHATMDLFNSMVRRGVRMTWDATNGVIARSLTGEMLAAAEASGCIGFNIGVESGNSDILRRIKKPGTVRIFLEAAATIRQFENINARAFLMIGFEGETLGQIKDTRDLALAMDLDWYNITPLQALPNTPLFNSAAWTGDFSEIRYNSGSHGRKFNAPAPFDFDDCDLDRVPGPGELPAIWDAMNRQLNFDRLKSETRPVKREIARRYADHISKVIDPGNVAAVQLVNVLTEWRNVA